MDHMILTLVIVCTWTGLTQVYGIRQRLICLETDPPLPDPAIPGGPVPARTPSIPAVTMTLSCPAGTKIEVVLARYGASPYGMCAPSVQDCMQDGPMPLRCCHMRRCVLGVRSRPLEYCRGQASYYQVMFHCKPDEEIDCSHPLGTPLPNLRQDLTPQRTTAPLPWTRYEVSTIATTPVTPAGQFDTLVTPQLGNENVLKKTALKQDDNKTIRGKTYNVSASSNKTTIDLRDKTPLIDLPTSRGTIKRYSTTMVPGLGQFRPEMSSYTEQEETKVSNIEMETDSTTASLTPFPLNQTDIMRNALLNDTDMLMSSNESAIDFDVNDTSSDQILGGQLSSLLWQLASSVQKPRSKPQEQINIGHKADPILVTGKPPYAITPPLLRTTGPWDIWQAIYGAQPGLDLENKPWRPPWVTDSPPSQLITPRSVPDPVTPVYWEPRHRYETDKPRTSRPHSVTVKPRLSRPEGKSYRPRPSQDPPHPFPGWVWNRQYTFRPRYRTTEIPNDNQGYTVNHEEEYTGNTGRPLYNRNPWSQGGDEGTERQNVKTYHYTNSPINKVRSHPPVRPEHNTGYQQPERTLYQKPEAKMKPADEATYTRGGIRPETVSTSETEEEDNVNEWLTQTEDLQSEQDFYTRDPPIHNNQNRQNNYNYDNEKDNENLKEEDTTLDHQPIGSTNISTRKIDEIYSITDSTYSEPAQGTDEDTTDYSHNFHNHLEEDGKNVIYENTQKLNDTSEGDNDTDQDGTVSDDDHRVGEYIPHDEIEETGLDYNNKSIIVFDRNNMSNTMGDDEDKDYNSSPAIDQSELLPELITEIMEKDIPMSSVTLSPDVTLTVESFIPDLDDELRRLDEEIIAADMDTVSLSFGTLLAIATGETIIFFVLLIILAVYIKRKPHRCSSPSGESAFYLNYDYDDEYSNGTDSSASLAANGLHESARRQYQRKSQRAAAYKINRPIGGRTAAVAASKGSHNAIKHTATICHIPQNSTRQYGKRTNKPTPSPLKISPDILNHGTAHPAPADLGQPRTPTRKYFYEEALTAFNLSPDEISPEEMRQRNKPGYTAVLDELSQTISRANSMEIRTSQRHMARQQFERECQTLDPRHKGHVTSSRQRSAPSWSDDKETHSTGRRSRSNPGCDERSVEDPRLREFAQNELEKINEQISILFQGSNVSARSPRPTSYV